MKENGLHFGIQKLVQAKNKARGLVRPEPVDPWRVPLHQQSKDKLSKSASNMWRWKLANVLRRSYYEDRLSIDNPDQPYMLWLMENVESEESGRQVEVAMRLAEVLRKDPHDVLNDLIHKQKNFEWEEELKDRQEKQAAHDEQAESKGEYYELLEYRKSLEGGDNYG